MKTVNVDDETWAALMKLKVDMRLDSLDSVILHLLGLQRVKAKA